MSGEREMGGGPPPTEKEETHGVVLLLLWLGVAVLAGLGPVILLAKAVRQASE